MERIVKVYQNPKRRLIVALLFLLMLIPFSNHGVVHAASADITFVDCPPQARPCETIVIKGEFVIAGLAYPTQVTVELFKEEDRPIGPEDVVLDSLDLLVEEDGAHPFNLSVHISREGRAGFVVALWVWDEVEGVWVLSDEEICHTTATVEERFPWEILALVLIAVLLLGGGYAVYTGIFPPVVFGRVRVIGGHRVTDDARWFRHKKPLRPELEGVKISREMWVKLKKPSTVLGAKFTPTTKDLPKNWKGDFKRLFAEVRAANSEALKILGIMQSFFRELEDHAFFSDRVHRICSALERIGGWGRGGKWARMRPSERKAIWKLMHKLREGKGKSGLDKEFAKKIKEMTKGGISPDKVIKDIKNLNKKPLMKVEGRRITFEELFPRLYCRRGLRSKMEKLYKNYFEPGEEAWKKVEGMKKKGELKGKKDFEKARKLLEEGKRKFAEFEKKASRLFRRHFLRVYNWAGFNQNYGRGFKEFWKTVLKK